MEKELKKVKIYDNDAFCIYLSQDDAIGNPVAHRILSIAPGVSYIPFQCFYNVSCGSKKKQTIHFNLLFPKMRHFDIPLSQMNPL